MPDFTPQDVLERNRKQAEGMWQDGKPKNWYYAIPNTKIVNGLNIVDMGIGSLITFEGEQFDKLEFDGD